MEENTCKIYEEESFWANNMEIKKNRCYHIIRKQEDYTRSLVQIIAQVQHIEERDTNRRMYTTRKLLYPIEINEERRII